MFQLLHPIVQLLQPFLGIICAVFAWVFVGLLIWNIWIAIAQGAAQVKRLHQIPCPNCQFFTGDYRLKCTVRPDLALTEDAINCRDFYRDFSK
jgi:hypothetical protein